MDLRLHTVFYETCQLLDARLQGASLPLTLAARVIIRGDVHDFPGHVAHANGDGD